MRLEKLDRVCGARRYCENKRNERKKVTKGRPRTEEANRPTGKGIIKKKTGNRGGLKRGVAN